VSFILEYSLQIEILLQNGLVNLSKLLTCLKSYTGVRRTLNPPAATLNKVLNRKKNGRIRSDSF